jgi:mRNA-binding protein PUF3
VRHLSLNSRPKSFLEDDKEGSFGPSFNNNGYEVERVFRDKRSSQDPGFLGVGVVGGPSRDSSIPPSRHSEDSHHSPTAFSEHYPFAGGHTPNNSIHIQRPSISGHSSSFSTQSTNQRAFGYNNKQIDESDLPVQFKNLNLEDGSNLALNGHASSSFPNPASQPFQLNPGSQPWPADVGGGSRFSNGFAADNFVDQLTPQFLPTKRGSGDRISPSAAAYRLVNSPKTYTSTPPDPWNPRPSSRDPRMAPEIERRSAAQQFLPAHTPSFYPHYYNPAFPGQYPQAVYDPYSAAQQGYRPQMLPGFGLPVNAYLPTVTPPVRPAKEQDAGKAVMSPLLEEFRSNSKSNKRYELKVCFKSTQYIYISFA